MGVEIDIKELINGCINGNRRSQEILHRNYYGKMMGVCLRYMQDKDEAKDVVQEGFIKVYNNLAKYDHSGSFDLWLKRIFVNTAIDFYRKNKTLQNIFNYNVEVEDVQEPIDENSSIGTLKMLSTPDILEAVQELTPVYRAVFNMYAIDGYNHHQISEALNINIGTSKSNYSKAKGNLQKILINKLETSNEIY